MKTFLTHIALNLVKAGAVLGLIHEETIFAPAQQLSVVSGSAITARQMVDSLFDSHFVVSNIVEHSDPQARGIFTDHGSNLGIHSGVILASGNVADCVGPNLNVYGANTSFGLGSTPDANLLSLLPAQSTLKDLASLELDVIPYTDTLILTYSFASEEYLTYSPPLDNSGKYNDVFGFFISGAGINGTQNIALVPGSSNKVSVCNVNPINNALFYVDNLTNMLGVPGTIEYNGFTKVMQAKVVLQRGQMYHVKIAIADVRDSYIDSGVFIKAAGTNSRNAALPVNFEMVNAINAGAINKIIWKTASEHNCEHFEVERSTDGKSFDKIASERGAGNSSIEKEYSSTDNAPKAGANYYRIKEVDFDGNFMYSNMVVASGNAILTAKIISVNATPGNLSIQLQSPLDANAVAEVVDVSGKVLLRQVVILNEGVNTLNLDVSQYGSGIYFLQFANSQFSTGFQKIAGL